MKRINDLANVRLLDGLHTRVERQHLVIDDRGDADPVDVVDCVERMAFDVIRWRAEVEAPPLEEHDRDVDTRVPRSQNAAAEPVKVRLVKCVEVKLWLTIPRAAGPGPPP